METLAILGMTALLGYSLATHDEPIRNVTINDTINDQVPLEEIPVNKNMYRSNMINAAEDATLQMSVNQYNKSKDPSLTGVLPPIYNSYSAVGDHSVITQGAPTVDGSVQVLANVNNVNRYVDVTDKGNAPALQSRPMFKPLLNLDTSEPTNFTNFGAGHQTNVETSLLTGQPLERDHNNLVPFFGSNVKQNTEAYTNVSSLDLYTGNRSTFIHKKEQRPFFESYQESIYGTPQVTTSIESDRFIPSVYRQNEKPFQQERVHAPVAFTVNNPTTVAATNYPTIDQMRTTNKPQVSYNPQMNPGQYGNVRGVHGNVAKNTVDTAFELGHDRLFTSTGVQINQQAPENYSQMQPTSRTEQNIEYYGGIVNKESLKTTPRYQTGNPNDQQAPVDNTNELIVFAQPDRRQQLASDTQRNIASATMTSHNDYGKGGYVMPELERDTTYVSQQLNANRSTTGHKTPLQDLPKNTIKETTLIADNSGHLKNIVNRSDTNGLIGVDLKQTNKETTVENIYKAPASKNDQMGYVVANYDAKTTNKETTGKTDYRGTAGPAQIKNPENRERFINAEISNTHEILVSNARPSGANHFTIAGGKNVVGENYIKPTMELRAEPNMRTENIGNISSSIPTKATRGETTNTPRNKYGGVENKQVTREFVNIVDSQLKANPFYNLNKQ